MGILLGPFDPLQLIFNTLNIMLKKGLISYDEARKVLKDSLNPQLPDDEKEKILDSLIKKI